MGSPEIIYKTKLPDEKVPYYRLTVYMDEMMQEPELISWYDWIRAKHIPACIAMGSTPGSYGRLAVWVIGQEYHEIRTLCNAEQMGRKIMSTPNWPEGI